MPNAKTVRISKNGAAVTEVTATSITINSGRAMVQLAGGYIGNFPLRKGSLYQLSFSDIEGLDTITGIFEDYTFNAGLTESVDATGQVVTGPAIYTNQLQFVMID